MNTVKLEPAAVVGFVQAALALVVAFGLHLSPEQIGAILAVVTAVGTLIVRQAVTPNLTVARKVRAARTKKAMPKG